MQTVKHKKLCLIVPDLAKGGMERVMSELANFFYKEKRASVIIVLFKRQSEIFYDVDRDVPIIKPGFDFRNKLRIFFTIRTLFFFRNVIKRYDPDAILSFGETYNSFVLLSALFLDKRVYVSDRSRPDKYWGLIHENLRRILYPTAAGIISQTNYSREFLSKKIKHQNIQVIPNPLRKVINTKCERKNVILNVGRIIRSKRLDLLLNIFSKCINTNWELWVVGEDESGEKDKLLKLSNDLKINQKVIFWGKQERIDDFYSMAKIFAFTSESEGLPNVLLEAMSAGLACISFDCIAGPKDLITDGETGYIVKMYDCEEYIIKLDRLLSDSQIRQKFSENARKKSEDYDINVIGEKYYNFLTS